MARRSGFPFDMSLRLWSDHIPLADIVASMNVPIERLYLKGKAIADHGFLKGRVSDTHYASIAQSEGKSFAEVTDWLRSICEKLESQEQLPALLRSGDVEATLWVALFGDEHFVPPILDQDIVDSAIRLNVKVFIENYTDPSDDCPSKTWYPSEVS